MKSPPKKAHAEEQRSGDTREKFLRSSVSLRFFGGFNEGIYFTIPIPICGSKIAHEKEGEI
jgi:hypothetical protein